MLRKKEVTRLSKLFRMLLSTIMFLVPGGSSLQMPPLGTSPLVPGVIRATTTAQVSAIIAGGIAAATLFAGSSSPAEASSAHWAAPSPSPTGTNGFRHSSDDGTDGGSKVSPTVTPSPTPTGNSADDNSCDDSSSDGNAKISPTATATVSRLDESSHSNSGDNAHWGSNTPSQWNPHPISSNTSHQNHSGSNQSSHEGSQSWTNQHPTSPGSSSSSIHPCANPDSDDSATPTPVTVTYPMGWGENDMGQVGDGTTIQRSTPITLTALTTVTMIEAGSEHALGLRSDGTVAAWGKNSNGQLGAPTTGTCSQPYNPNPIACTLTPVEVVGPGGTGFLSGITQVAGGEYDSVALKNDGTVWTWGGSSNSSIPVQVSGLSNIDSVAMQGFTGYALKSDGTVWAWGENGDGELGNGTKTNSSTPVQVSGLTGVTAIAAGEFDGVALKSDGTVWAWGMGWIWGSYGNPDQLTPAQLPGFSGITAIAAGFENVTALKSDGTVWTIGINDYGELGNSTVPSTMTAVPVQTTAGTPLTSVKAIAGDYWSNLALLSNQTVVAWGDNLFGELGVASTDTCGGNPCSQTAIPVAGLSNVVRLGIGGYNGFAFFQETSSSSNGEDCTCQSSDSGSGDDHGSDDGSSSNEQGSGSKSQEQNCTSSSQTSHSPGSDQPAETSHAADH